MQRIFSDIWRLKKNGSPLWQHMSLIPALWRQRQADLSAFETNLVCKVSFRTMSPVTRRNSVMNNQKEKKNKKMVMGKVKATPYFSGLSWRSGNKQAWPWCRNCHVEGGLPRKCKFSVSLMGQFFFPWVIVFSNESTFLSRGILGRALMGSITLMSKGKTQ